MEIFHCFPLAESNDFPMAGLYSSFSQIEISLSKRSQENELSQMKLNTANHKWCTCPTFEVPKE